MKPIFPQMHVILIIHGCALLVQQLFAVWLWRFDNAETLQSHANEECYNQ